MAKKGALSDIKVVEWGEWVSAPFCGKLLADMGAEVIKIEKPGAGDKARQAGPFPKDSPNLENSGLFLYLNTNKLGITLNLNTDKGKQIFKDLIRDADVLVENNPPGIPPALGLDYGSLKSINKRLIMTSITPFGQRGPHKDYKSSELINIHMAGVGYISPRANATWGMASKTPSEVPPLRTPGRQGDLQGGLQGAVGTMGALAARNKLGTGQHVDISVQECFFAFLTPALYRYTAMGGNIQHRKEAFPLAWYLLPCKDGHVFVGWQQQSEWESFIDLMGNPEWAKSDVFKDQRSVIANWDAVAPQVIEFFKDHTGEEIFNMAQARHLTFAPVKSPKDVTEWYVLKKRGFFIDITNKNAGRIKMPGAPYKFSETPWTIRNPSPLLGEHNEDVYCKKLGYSKNELANLKKQGII